MKKIEFYFQKLNTAVSNWDNALELFKETIFKYSGVQLQNHQIILRNNKLTIEASPLVKNQIYLKKNLILSELKNVKAIN